YVQVIPAIVCPEGRHKSCHKSCNSALCPTKVRTEIGPRTRSRSQSDKGNPHNHCNLQDGERKLKIARLADSYIVQCRDQHGGCDGDQMAEIDDQNTI